MDHETTDLLNRVVWAPMPYTKHHVEVHESEVIPVIPDPCSLPTFRRFHFIQWCHFSCLPSWNAGDMDQSFTKNNAGTGEPTNQSNPSNLPSNHPTYHPTIQPTIQPSNLPSNPHYNGLLGPKSHWAPALVQIARYPPATTHAVSWNMTPSVLGNIWWLGVGRNHLNLSEVYCTESS